MNASLPNGANRSYPLDDPWVSPSRLETTPPSFLHDEFERTLP